MVNFVKRTLKKPSDASNTEILGNISKPADLKTLDEKQIDKLCLEIRGGLLILLQLMVVMLDRILE